MRSTKKSFGAKRGSPCDKLATNLRLDLAEWTARLSLPSQWRGEKHAPRETYLRGRWVGHPGCSGAVPRLMSPLLFERGEGRVRSRSSPSRWRNVSRLAEATARQASSLDITHYFFGSARRIKSPSQSGCATPWRYACSDSTEEFTRRLL